MRKRNHYFPRPKGFLKYLIFLCRIILVGRTVRGLKPLRLRLFIFFFAAVSTIDIVT